MAKDIYIDSDELSSRLLNKTKDHIDTAQAKIKKVGDSPSYRGPDGYAALYTSSMMSELSSIRRKLNSLESKLEQYGELLNSGPDALAQVDKDQKNKVSTWWERTTSGNTLFGRFIGNDLKSEAAITKVEASTSKDLGGILASATGSVSTGYYEGKISSSANWDLDKGNAGVSVAASAEAGVLSARGEASYGLISADGEVNVGVVGVEAKGTINLINDGELDPKLELSAKARAEGITGKVGAQLGTDDYNVHMKAEGTVGVAEAEARGSISRDGVSGKVKVGAAALSGKASCGFTLFGVKIDASVKGEALAVGAEAEFNTTKSSFELGGKLSFLAGVGLKIKVSW